MAKKTKMTLEGLAQMMQAGFIGIKEQFDNKIDTFRNDVNLEFSKIYEQISKLPTREELHSFARSWVGEVVKLEDEIKSLRKRVEMLESKNKQKS